MRARPSRARCLILCLLFSSLETSFASAPPFSNVVKVISRRGQTTLTRSIPALSVYNGGKDRSRETLEVASVKRKRKLKLPMKQLATGGFYYGVDPKTMSKATASGSPAQRKPKLSESMFEALEELKYLRQEMETMRKEMRSLRQQMVEDGDLDEIPEETRAKQLAFQKKRQKECEKLAGEIEDWAMQVLRETEEDGWKEISCSKVLRKSINPTGRTTAYLKWMTDSRGDRAANGDQTEYPCIKCYATIDAPLEDVCTYLSQESASPEYNDVIVKWKDIEEISPNSKITWSQSPQILFLKPREFITFCHHRWKRDGTEVIVNQAWDHPDYPATNDENTAGKCCRALALRGANVLSRDPEFPEEKTRIAVVAHADPGGGLPRWATKTAVNALAPIEPFKLFHKIDAAVKKNPEQLRQRLQQAEMVSTAPPGRSPRPAGISQLGYACFWPNGGGIAEGGYRKKHAQENEGESTIEEHSPSAADDNNNVNVEEDNSSGMSAESDIAAENLNEIS